MTTEYSTTKDTATVVTAFAADLADAAYAVVLRHGVGGSWIDMQLEVWRALAETIGETEWQTLETQSPGEFAVWREALLSRATEAAYRTALQHELQGPFVDVELDLHLALRQVMERYATGSRLARVFGPGAQVVADAVLSRVGQQVHRAQDIGCCCHPSRA